ncbi:MAG TPA: hypothetical protein VI583_18330 [Cyclobacteriaceae bacterium]|nr:hypothetical protein [Cyclobacteriaceae bacterium]
MDHTEYPERKTYKKRMPVFWWTKHWSDFLFIMRELTSLPVAWSCILLIWLVRSLDEGPEAYYNFIDKLSSPAMIVINIFAFAGLVFHSITWFSLAPKAMVLKIGRYRVPGPLIAWMNYSGWLIASIAIICILN